MALSLGSRRAILDAYATAASAIQNPRHFPGSPSASHLTDPVSPRPFDMKYRRLCFGLRRAGRGLARETQQPKENLET
jgi:hypothetical protein